jgi:hypothetical protein
MADSALYRAKKRAGRSARIDLHWPLLRSPPPRRLELLRSNTNLKRKRSAKTRNDWLFANADVPCILSLRPWKLTVWKIDDVVSTSF